MKQQQQMQRCENKLHGGRSRQTQAEAGEFARHKQFGNVAQSSGEAQIFEVHPLISDDLWPWSWCWIHPGTAWQQVEVEEQFTLDE